LYETTLKSIQSKSVISDSTQKEIREFITYSDHAIYTDGKFIPIYDQEKQKYIQQFAIVQFPLNGMQPVGKNAYYFNVLVSHEDNQDFKKEIHEKRIDLGSNCEILLISGDIEIQPPYPIPEDLPTEDSVSQESIQVSSDLLSGLAAKFGNKGKRK
jgi:hypothetical protein